MDSPATLVSRALARDAEAVCRHYLTNGRREGRYWLVGDVENTPGRSLFVRLTGPDQGKGAAGKWTDAATGEHGDLLDLIAANLRLASLSDAITEARAFLRLPRPEAPASALPAPQGSPEAARRLWAIAQPIGNSLAQSYLLLRGIANAEGSIALRFHPHCWYRPSEDDAPGTRSAWPALIAAVTDGRGAITGLHRTWLDPANACKAPIATPRRAMGHLLGHGVRFGASGPIMAAGEGLETMLSLREVLRAVPMIAALSASHLPALLLPSTLRRLYIVRDGDPAGRAAVAALAARARATGIETLTLDASLGDLNDDLCSLDRSAFAQAIGDQLAPDDASRLLGARGREGVWCGASSRGS